jgi:hypothetical protein
MTEWCRNLIPVPKGNWGNKKLTSIENTIKEEDVRKFERPIRTTTFLTKSETPSGKKKERRRSNVVLESSNSAPLRFFSTKDKNSYIHLRDWK